MERIIIERIGPINRVELALRRVNVFIGPQGSGKSTVAKLVSFCQWVEKDCVRRQSIHHLGGPYVHEQLIRYHNIEGDLSDKSCFDYEGEALHLHYENGEMRAEKKEGFYSKGISKNAYIPAERNIISVPGIFSTKMPFSYLTDFIDDWQRVRDKYRNGEKVELLDLHQSYRYDVGLGKDMVVSDGGEREFELSQVSSGLQSVVPLCVMIDYLTDWVYSHNEDRSSEERRLIREAALVRLLANQEGIEDVREKLELNPEGKEAFIRLSNAYEHLAEEDISNLNKEAIEELNKVKEREETLTRPGMSNLVIEEPELNLFPTTQVSLVYYLLKKINHGRDMMVITTHSPYILYALNNCMLAWLASQTDAELVTQISEIPEGSRVDPGNVAVWELREGEIYADSEIQDNRGLIRDNYFDRVMKGVMVEFRNLMNFV